MNRETNFWLIAVGVLSVLAAYIKGRIDGLDQAEHTVREILEQHLQEVKDRVHRNSTRKEVVTTKTANTIAQKSSTL